MSSDAGLRSRSSAWQPERPRVFARISFTPERAIVRNVCFKGAPTRAPLMTSAQKEIHRAGDLRLAKSCPGQVQAWSSRVDARRLRDWELSHASQGTGDGQSDLTQI